jgi:RNA polymerase sigma factor (sigma-70 family)
MIRSIWRVTRNAHDAEDAMQNALVTIWKRWTRICRHASPQALVLRICIDAALDITRRRAREGRNVRLHNNANQAIDGSGKPLERIADDELRREILAAIGRLSRRQALAVMLRVFEELPYGQIAAAIGCTEPTARKHFERGRANLRHALARHESIISPGVHHEPFRR